MTLPSRRQVLTLWLPVTLAFMLVITAWVFLISIAQEHPVEMIEVPMPTPSE